MEIGGHTEEKDAARDHEIEHPANQFPVPTINKSSLPSSRSSHDSDLSAFDAAAHVHPPTPDMDGPDVSIRRRPLIMENEVPNTGGHAGRKSRPHRSRNRAEGSSEGEQKLMANSDDGQTSEFSTPSASEDVELENLPSDNGLTDDEETGLTRKDKRKRKRRKTLSTNLDGRVAVSTGDSGWSLADRNVVKASLINVVLIASWYLFSVSISVVSWSKMQAGSLSMLTTQSTINGCSRRRLSTSNSRSSQPVCTWPSSFYSPQSFCISFHALDRDWTVLLILETMRMRMPNEINPSRRNLS